MKITIDKASVALVQDTMNKELGLPVEKVEPIGTKHLSLKETEDTYEIWISSNFLMSYLKLVVKYQRVLIGICNLVAPLLDTFKRDTEELAEMLMEKRE